MIRRLVALVASLSALVGGLGCGARDRAGAASVGIACDSTRAVRIALDSMGQVYRFKSSVHRYGRDATGLRVVTLPTPGQSVRDGMAIVLVDHACRISRLTLTDSA